MEFVEGKNRVRLEWLDGYGHTKTQIIPNTVKIDVAEGVFFLYVEEDDQLYAASIIPLTRLVRAAALKNTEVTDEEGEAGESAEDEQVPDSADE